MKKVITSIIFLSFLMLVPLVQAAESDLTKRLAGRILLQVESYGRAWYVDPVSTQRYYLSDGNEAYYLMRTKGLGITNADLAKIPIKKGQPSNASLVNRLKGRILLQVEENGEAWYVDPVEGVRFYMSDGLAAYNLMRTKGLGITNADLAKIKMNNEQVVHDTTFNDLAYVYYDGSNFFGEHNADQILPLASLTKLMTALVLLDTSPVWDRRVMLTTEQINYPKTLVGSDASSEVDFKSGDFVRIYDLWVAMLVASSNQAAVAIADSTGFSRAEFVHSMNDKAAKLGLTKTKFYDMTGLDAHNVTTAKEMAKIAQEAFSNSKITEAGARQDYIISAIASDLNSKDIKVVDRNYSLQQFGVEASKTGYLVEAQRTVALKKNGGIVVVLHALSMSSRNEAIKKLLK